LLKHHDSITQEQQKSIFSEDRQSLNKSRKQIETLMRDRKVEELKKCLSKQVPELPTLSQRKEHYMQGDERREDNQPSNCRRIPLKFLISFLIIYSSVSKVSNPPPSPVGAGQEQDSPEYRTHEININVVDTTELRWRS